MPPSTRSRPSAPPTRIYESSTPLTQAKLPPIRQRVYGRHSLRAPLTKKRQGTLTQIGFVNPEKIEDEIAEYERAEMERGKRRKTEGGTPVRKGLRAKPGIGMRNTPVSGTRLMQMMDKKKVDEEGMNVVPAQRIVVQLNQQESVERLDDTPEPETDEGRPRKKRKSRKGITVRVKTVIIKVESPEVERTQYNAQFLHHKKEQEETQSDDINMVIDSFQAAPIMEKESSYESYVKIKADQVDEAQRRRNRVIPDSDAESEDESIVYDSNDESRNEEVSATPSKKLTASMEISEPRVGSDVDLNEVKDSVEDKTNAEQDLDQLHDITEKDKPDADHDVAREIPDSQAESEDDEDIDLDIDLDMAAPAAAPRCAPEQEDTLILNSFSVPSSGTPAVQPRLKAKKGPTTIPDSFSVPASPTAESGQQQPAIIKSSFYKKPPTFQQSSSSKRLAPPVSSPIRMEEVNFVPSSSAVSVPEAPPIPNVQHNVAAMQPPPVTPRKPLRTEIPNTGSTCSELSTQSTIRSMTPNSMRSKTYDRSPIKAYSRSPLKKLTEKIVLHQSLDLPRLNFTPSQQARSSLRLRESQISTQGTPTQRSRASQGSPFVEPEPPKFDADVYDGEETTIIPESPTPVKPERSDTQITADTNSPSRQIHSELSATLHSGQPYRPSSSDRTVRFLKTEIKDSQAQLEEEFDDGEYHHSIEKPQDYSDEVIYVDGEYHHSIEDESMEIVVEGDRDQVTYSSKVATPRVVRFQSIPASIPAQLRFDSSPLNGSGSWCVNTQASSMSRPSVIDAETQMRSQWLATYGASSNSIHDNVEQTQGTMEESQWLGDLLPESLMGLSAEELSVPPIMDDDSVWDEFRSSRSGIDEIED